MILDAKSGLRGVLVRADTGERIPCARWANLDTGEWEALAVDPLTGQPAHPARLIRGQCPLRFVPAAPVFSPPAPASVKTSREAAESLAEAKGRVRRVLAVPGRGCEEKGCTALACYETADEQHIEPVAGADGRLCERALTVRKHRWCARHFRSPVQTNLRGVESEVEVTVRPQ
jgi:hypothetical protein